jgi:hypothetical protein
MFSLHLLCLIIIFSNQAVFFAKLRGSMRELEIPNTCLEFHISKKKTKKNKEIPNHGEKGTASDKIKVQSFSMILCLSF